MKQQYILAIDQGTTSSRSILFNFDFEIIGIAQQEIDQIYPQSGWVEHNPKQIWETQQKTMRDVVDQAKISPNEIAAIGITNQRETTVAWNGITGLPLTNAIVWQDRRTAEFCNALHNSGAAKNIHQKTGLIADAYFSGSKMLWILEHQVEAKVLLAKKQLRLGTIDTWLLWHLTGGRAYKTDVSNASRTMCMDLKSLEWDNELMSLFGVNASCLPKIEQSNENFGTIDNSILGNTFDIPIMSMIGDQQAALFGQDCFAPGMVKNTYGTGCFMLMNTGEKPIHSNHGLLTTVGWKTNEGVTYALEGSVFVTGAVVQWLRDELHVIKNAAESEVVASSINDTEGVYFIPAFAGLGTPHWQTDAKGMIVGLTRSTGKAHIIRAALESIAYQTKDVIDTMELEAGISLTALKVDGGATTNQFLMQFQADILQKQVKRATIGESTALGTAKMAYLGHFGNLPKQQQHSSSFAPTMPADDAREKYEKWMKAIQVCIQWI